MPFQLREQGFTEAYALLGGFDAWQSAGFWAEPKVSPAREGNYDGVRRAVTPWSAYGGLAYFHFLLERLVEAGYES